MKTRVKTIINRLKKPSVIASLISQIATLLVLFNMDEAAGIFKAVATVLLSTLVLLGVLSNPDTKKNGYGDDMYICKNCNKCSVHVEVGGKLLCKECGSETILPEKCTKKQNTA